MTAALGSASGVSADAAVSSMVDRSMMVAELQELPVEVLQLHLNHYRLVPTDNRAAMDKHLHIILHAGDGARNTAPTTSEHTIQ